VIEQYRVGDLDSAAAAETEQHLASCPACAEVYAYIVKDTAALPPLPVPLRSPKKTETKPKPRIPSRTVIGLMAAAATVLLVLNIFNTDPKTPPPRITTKGGDLALSMVRQRGETVDENPTQFEEGDRFRLLLTAPYEGDIPIEVVVFQGDEAFFPYPENLSAASGNQKGIDGAFTLFGDEDATICVIAEEPIPSRAALREMDAESLPENSVCQKLEFNR
jgi:hypothetical protein